MTTMSTRTGLTVSFPDAPDLDVDGIERLMIKLDLLWVDFAQLTEYLAEDGQPRTRGNVVRPSIDRTGLRPPYRLVFGEGPVPVRPALWELFTRMLEAPDRLADWLPDWVEDACSGWSEEERARHGAVLVAAMQARTLARVTSGEADAGELTDPLGRLLRRAAMDAERLRRDVGQPRVEARGGAGSAPTGHRERPISRSQGN
jgi:hypothetical protein